MSEEMKLKDCPFCGSSNIGFVELLNAVLCDGCDTAISKNPYKPNEGIVKQWNTRTTERSEGAPKQPDNSEALRLIDTTMRGVALSALCNAGKINQEPLLDQLSEIKDLLEGGEGEQ
jgi:hypothetical protein